MHVSYKHHLQVTRGNENLDTNNEQSWMKIFEEFFLIEKIFLLC